ncbi:unannotated protein [freshwater metagenome]|uniref:Unannotated protein n=1 Tax=freshwater metagenome TaxID=449393 RepID=A0A6J7EXP9_9ZZZZ|nr:DUF2461 family protein [Actinomycetota bacterium]
MAFHGFSEDALAFYEGLAGDNSKLYWQANKGTYDLHVKGAMLGLLEQLDEFGPFHVFRPFNDARFSKGRPPYKEHIGALGEREGGAVFYVQFSAAGLVTGSGYYAMANDQLERFRTAIDDEHRGAEVQAICSSLTKRGYTIGAISELKTAPRGYPKDHPRIELLRRKGLTAFKSWGPEPWMQTPAVVKRVRDSWNGAGKLDDWLDSHVGPSTLPPPDWDRP